MEQQYPISSDTIKKILNKHNLGILKSFVPIKAGLINPAFLINDRCVLRIDKSDHLKGIQGHDSRFEREMFLYDLLPKRGIPVPQCLGFDSSQEIIPEKYIIISYIKGTSLSDGFKDHDKKTQRKLSFQMGEILEKIHSITPEDLDGGDQLFGPKVNWKKLYEKEFDLYLEKAMDGKYFLPEIEAEIKKIYLQFQNKVSDLKNELRLVHSDFSAGNIQINGGEIVGIFDFEWSHIGDPLWDLQKLLINFQLGNGFSKADFLKGYQLENITDEERTRIKMYTLHQGLWEIWATKTQLFPFGEKEIAEGNQLIQSVKSL